MTPDWGGILFPNDSGMGILNPFDQYPIAGGFDQGDDWLDLNVAEVAQEKPMSVARTDSGTSSCRF
jgi:hypothetical protein